MENNPKFAIDLDDFDTRLAQAIESERPAPLSIPCQDATSSSQRTSIGSAKPASALHEFSKGSAKPASALHEFSKGSVKPASALHEFSEGDRVVHPTRSVDKKWDSLEVGRNVMIILSTICSSAVSLALWKSIEGDSSASLSRMIVLSIFASSWIGLVIRCLELIRACGNSYARRIALQIATLIALAAFVGITSLWLNVPVLEAISILGWSGLCRWGYEQSMAWTKANDQVGITTIPSSSHARAQLATRNPLLVSVILLTMGCAIAWLQGEWHILSLASISIGVQWLFWIAYVVIESTNEPIENRQALGGGF